MYVIWPDLKMKKIIISGLNGREVSHAKFQLSIANRLGVITGKPSGGWHQPPSADEGLYTIVSHKNSKFRIFAPIRADLSGSDIRPLHWAWFSEFFTPTVRGDIFCPV